MALKDLAVVTEDHLEEGVLLQFWYGDQRRIAVINRTALDDTFDRMLPFGPKERRLTVPQWNGVVQENLAAFGRIIEARYARALSAAGKPVDRVDIDLQDIQGSGEQFTWDSLQAAGIKRRSA